jgi:DNA-binding NarL/FixJ family response regulator
MINVMKDKSTPKNSIRQINVELLLGERQLTTRQLEIVKLCASDLCDKQIADQLGITISTLNSHKHLIFEKLNVHSKSGLINEAFHSKIIQ